VSRIEIIPPELLLADKLDLFVVWLNANIVSPMVRKEMLCEWCQYTGVKLTGDLVDRVYEE
jgi:hypothetical protein